MIDKEKTFQDFQFTEIQSAFIQISKIPDDEEGFIYCSGIGLELGDKDSITLILDTQLANTCERCLCSDTLQLLGALTDNIYDTVLMFDENGEQIEELSLTDMFDEEDDDVSFSSIVAEKK